MKALTIRQPWAHLIVTPDEFLPQGIPQKRVENRGWKTPHRGPLLIHAGASRDDLRLAESPDGAEHVYVGVSGSGVAGFIAAESLAFGAIVGVVDLVECLPVATIQNPSLPLGSLGPGYDWLRYHVYNDGPVCWVLRAAARFPEPIPYRGRQGLFDVPQAVVDKQLRAVGWDQ